MNITIDEYRKRLCNLIKLQDEIIEKCKETGGPYIEVLKDMRSKKDEI